MEEISFNLWAIIVLTSAIHGIFLSIYLLSKSKNASANKWLSFLLIAISLHLFEYAADISGMTIKFPVLISITYPLLFCIGPFYFFYCRSLLDKDHFFTLRSLLHFIPAFLILFLMLPFYSMPASEKLKFIAGLSNGNSIKIPVEQLLFMASHVVQTVAYSFASYKFIARKENELKQYSSDTFAIKKLEWLNSFNLFFAIYLLLYFILVFALSAIDSYQIQIDYTMLLITSLSIYAVGYKALNNPEIFKLIPEVFPNESYSGQKEIVSTNSVQHAGLKEKFPDNFVAVPVNTETTPSNLNQSAEQEEKVFSISESDEELNEKTTDKIAKYSELKEKLLNYMETNKPYLKSDLKISDLAESLSVPYHELSQTINDEFLVNFYDFVNKYRVEEAKKLLLSNKRNFKILAIAFEVGFNSKATFNRVFKKFTGLTPSDFKEKTCEVKNESSSLQS